MKLARSRTSKHRRSGEKRRERDFLAGTWIKGDEYGSEVEFTITRSGDSYLVGVCDCFDCEEAEVYETAWGGGVLSFSTYWNSTGRFARYRLSLLSANRLDVTYTYTDSEMYHRKGRKLKA